MGVASFDRKAFLSFPTGSSYLELDLSLNHYSLESNPSTHIFCAKKLEGFALANPRDRKCGPASSRECACADPKVCHSAILSRSMVKCEGVV